MFETLNEDLLELTVVERGYTVGNALPAFPLCCSLVLCIGCSSCSSSSKNETA
ncbi:MAG: hypothetical protein JOZ56_10855 [Actinobacteria bacterium]|nr:hypothetical protein [Actinomycetota bacterium]